MTDQDDGAAAAPLGLAGRISAGFIDNPVTPILILIAMVLGVIGISQVPREEEPQIPVPLVEVIVPAPGLSAQDVLETVTRPVEDIVTGIEGVDHVYSRSREDQAVVSARFYPGTSSDDAALRVIERIGANGERRPPGIPEPLIVARGIEDVAVVTLTVAPTAAAADRYSRADAWDVAEELRWRMASIDRAGLTYLVGAGGTQVRVEPDPRALARWGVSASALAERVAAANENLSAGDLLSPQAGRQALKLGGGLRDPASIGNLVVTSRDGRPVYVRDLARTLVAPPQPGPLVWHRDTGSDGSSQARPAAVLAVGKRPGANGVEVAEAALKVLASARDQVIPDGMTVTVTRNYGKSANDNARALLWQLIGATLTIVLLIAVAVGLREAIVVGLVIPTTILLTFFALWAFGYTINRVSLFALIFAIGILVDDAIVVVENITRHWAGAPPEDSARAAASAVRAVDEVGNPTIISTLTIIAALLPMLAVTGLMGPYMAPIPANASAAVIFSTAVALSATPWLLLRLRRLRAPWPRLLGRRGDGGGESSSGGPLGTLYRRVAEPVLRTRRRAALFLLAVLLATLGSLALFAVSAVTVKLLPFDDKREIQVVVDLPETATVEQTDRVLGAIAERLAPVPEITSLQRYAGTSAPFNFNGLIRQYYLRELPFQGDIKVNLLPAADRARSSHAIALAIRERIDGVSAPAGTAMRVVEVPPGPPVLATLLAEVYGPNAESRRAAARDVRAAFTEVDFVVDVDDSIGVRRERLQLSPDQAALTRLGVSEGAVLRELGVLLGGRVLEPTTDRPAQGAWPVVIELARRDRGELDALLSAPVPAAEGLVELGQVVDVARRHTERPVFRRNGRSLVMVQATLAGEREAPIYGMLQVQDALQAAGAELDVRLRGQPLAPEGPVLLWHGEWEITYTTFRDMGLAFIGAFLLIYALVVGRSGRLKLPLAIMLPVPLTLLGIIVGHWAIGAKFTATSMIGFIALAGIVVRNSVLLIEFIEARRAAGASVRDAVIEAGAVRFRPILLTAVTAMIGALFIIVDPIFKGLATSLFFGLISSTLLTTLAIPALYIWRRGDDRDPVARAAG
ncbi:multidrug transporter AcrB [Thiohalocapsa halophila]|uniref:Multidrug transporter AcrB n=1 Tax=Thiohalocapsa halophila TaxID=69359 RepID=A0ABS1CI66_9GAMM|nr:efflux RND transporter permease subunit [Thiohalocapsa halophila]MBK1631606.1 multidrug transporter AcrB [Thiohalocapsa halophila]